jgi:peptide/nickel transport system permease protein
VLVLAVTSLLVFGGLYLIGDPVEILVNPSADQIEKERATIALGLDKPIHEQYLTFVKGAFTGNLGNSFVYGRPALEVIFERMPATLELAFAGDGDRGRARDCRSGLRRAAARQSGIEGDHGRLDPRLLAADLLGRADPDHGVRGAARLAAVDRARPTTDVLGLQVSIFNWDGLRYALLPAINLALFKLSLIIRLTRAQVREQSLLDYIKFARAKGLEPTGA